MGLIDHASNRCLNSERQYEWFQIIWSHDMWDSKDHYDDNFTFNLSH